MGLNLHFNPTNKMETGIAVISNWEKDDWIILFNRLRVQMK